MQIAETQLGCVALQTARGPSGLPLSVGTWYLRFQMRFLEMPGQHRCLPWLRLHGGSQQDSFLLLAMCEASVCQVNAHFSNILCVFTTFL